MLLRPAVLGLQVSESSKHTSLTIYSNITCPEQHLHVQPPHPRPPHKLIPSMPRQTKRYNSIKELWQNADRITPNIPSDKVNVYGVVVDCRAPYKTKGPDLRCEVEIADETSLFDGGTELKTLKIYCFERNPVDCIPFRAFGDVLRAHRIHVNMYTTDATKILQGVGRFYSTFMLWSAEGQDFQPVAVRDAVPVSRSGRSSLSSQSVTEDDERKVSRLRQWSLNVLANRCRVHRPHVQTISEILSSPNHFDVGDCVDVLCVIDNIVNLPDGNVEFFVHDGSEISPCRERVFVHSRTEQSSSDSNFTFADLCPSWGLRPTQYDSWAMIRDIHPFLSSGRWSFSLSIGHKTSTLIWYSPNFARRQLLNRNSSTTDGIRFYIEPDIRSQDAAVASSSPEQVPPQPVRRLCHQGNGGIPSNATENLHTCKNPESNERDGIDPVSTIRTVRTSAITKQHSIYNVFIRIRSCTFPSDLRFSCHLACACDSDISNVSPEAGQTCPRCIPGNNSGKVGWQYRIRFLVEDRDGDRIDMWVAGDLSKEFFRDIPPGDFISHEQEYAAFRRHMQTVLGQGFFNCKVLPYEYEDEHGIYRVACQLVAC